MHITVQQDQWSPPTILLVVIKGKYGLCPARLITTQLLARLDLSLSDNMETLDLSCRLNSRYVSISRISTCLQQVQTKYFLLSLFKECPFWLVNCCSYSRWHILKGVKQRRGLIEMAIIEHTHTGCSFAAADAIPFWISFLLLTEQLFPLSCASVLRGLLLITG